METDQQEGYYRSQRRDNNDKYKKNRGYKDKERGHQNSNKQQYKDVAGLIQRPPEDIEKQKMKEKTNEWLKKMKETENDEMIQLRKQIGFNLNILTPDNYDKLKDKLAELALKGTEAMEIFIEIILEKAWEDKLYVKLYAELCSYIHVQNKAGGNGKFKGNLLARIQNVFEHQKVIKEEISKEQYEDPESNAEILRKKKRRE